MITLYDRFTVIIPEHNRPEHLERLLAYYLSFGIKIIVADSSDKFFSHISNYENKIEYKHTPKKALAEKIREITNLISTPYVFMCANDDFIIPDTVNRVIDFLEENPAYNSGQGIYIDFCYKNGTIMNSLRYRHMIGENISECNPSKRIMHLMSNYFQYYYCVYRTETFNRIYESVIHKDRTVIHNLNLLELYISLYPVIEGKHIVLPLLYSARENISNSIGNTADDIAEVISKKKYQTEYNDFITLLSSHLLETEHLTFHEAKDVIEKAVVYYMDYWFPQYFLFKRKVRRFIIFFFKKLRLYQLILKIRKKRAVVESSVDALYPFNEQDIEHWNIIKNFIMQYKNIYR